MRILIALCLLLAGCIPKIYVIDRQTVLEDEAAGEWPEFERRLTEPTQQKTPTAAAKSRSGEKRERLYRVLNGDVTGQAGKTAAKVTR